VYWVWWAKIKPRFLSKSGNGGSWMRSHKFSASDQGVMMGRIDNRFEKEEGSEGDQVQSLLGGGSSDGEEGGMKKRAPCGCMLDHSKKPIPNTAERRT